MTFAFRCLAYCLPWVATPLALAAVCEQAPLAYLVSHPDSCDGERVEVTGYLTHGLEDSTIWVSKEDAEQIQLGHRLRLEFSPETEILPGSFKAMGLLSISGHHVSVLGRVNRSVHGHLGAYVGAINVGLVRVLDTALAAADDLFDHVAALERIGDEVDYLPAAQAYRAALVELETSSSSPEGAHVGLRLGMCLAKLGRHDEAIASFRKVLATNSDSNTALRLIAESLFAKREYEAALAALHEAESRYPLHSGCGTCDMEHRRRFLFSVGILNEWLRRYERAVDSYLNAGGMEVHLRLLALYESAGQLQGLLGILHHNDPSARPNPLSETVHRVLEIRQVAAERDWKRLVNIVDTSQSRFEVEEAARLLARHKRATLPFLLAGLERPEAAWRTIPAGRWYALALAEAPEAVEVLKMEVKREQNYEQLRGLVYFLSAAGAIGQAALKDLGATAENNLKTVIERNRPGSYSWESPETRVPYPFPEIPPGIRLPTRCERQDGRTGYVCEKPLPDKQPSK